MRHPLRLLLHIEWILFAVVMALELQPHQPRGFDRPVWLNIAIVVWLAILGLRLPGGKLSTKVIYTLAEILPILVVAYTGMRSVGLLCVIIVFRSYLIFGREYRLWVTGGIFTLFTIAFNFRVEHRPPPPEIAEQPHPEFRWAVVVLFGAVLFCLQLLVDRIIAEKQAKEELEIANQRIRNYALRAEEVATLQERNRIAREIHDSLGHSLTALNLHLEIALKLTHLQPNRSTQLLKEAKRLGSIALSDVRQSVSALRSNPLQGQDLPTAIQKLIDDFQLAQLAQPICQLDLPPNLSPDVATAIYRIIQEGLTNITKYANAREVSVTVQTRGSEIELQIVDNGCGFIPTHNTTGFGLAPAEQDA